MIDFLFNPNGRVSRKGIWLLFVGSLIVSMVMEYAPETAVMSVVVIIISLLSFWASIAVSIKRFHDRNMTGWWVLIYILVMIPGFIWAVVNLSPDLLTQLSQGVEPTITQWQEGVTMRSILGFVWVLAICLIQFIILYFLPGTEGDNRFGADPKKSGKGLAS